ncbi:MAG TPA: pteridine reductase [Candidatus Acidoferrum sp.]|nr:pteridine reductase [Candidatus Acidoferrum sp.]
MTAVALVTGGAARIGAVIVQTLHAAGYNVVLHYHRSHERAAALAAALNATRRDSAMLVQADLLDLAAIERLAREAHAAWGRVDLLVNNASTFFPTPLGTITEAHWNNLIGSNARAPLWLCQQLAPALTAANGSIVNIIDSTSRYGLAEFVPYAMAKAALANMTRSLARALAPHVRVNGVAPGAILWPEYTGGVSEQERQATLARTMLGRLGTPQDIAHAVAFLAGATYVTGQIIKVDGGVRS